MNGSTDPALLIRQLADATNAHDLDALVGCFADAYRNDTPTHPKRGFRGAAQVRRNWTQLFGGVPDLSARILAMAVAGDTVWSEWEMSGTRRDGVAHLMRGVIIFDVTAGRIASARFYLEPVEDASGDVDEAIARATSTGPQHHTQP
jgi:ketosteroid isomerase-like protein